MDVVIHRFDIWLVSLDPTKGSEIAKTRPCLVVSPDEVNRRLNTVLIAPMTSTRKLYPTRINTHFAGQDGQIALDQLRSVDKTRLVKRLGSLDDSVCQEVCQTLVALFVY
ncbi:type II toxin-antitoxin system PemK/MazF family toxin [Spirosoma sp. KUDC1026]|uniref:type II toxin-antitoxin system PemK/MazF family toxin n=1 Tax=Spirosoma sp. KUDC1026 TaxID=2745947 RepID=UPI00159BE963|nr:type II toxin-antitoxin system PemK/MazF family toxin [Spirosoma sp. KUDC1026]QKZ13674.1 type II toxin-antitoxin system PemK/MazF family toxin [Spirosoma sp. KUDC1026]